MQCHSTSTIAAGQKRRLRLAICDCAQGQWLQLGCEWQDKLEPLASINFCAAKGTLLKKVRCDREAQRTEETDDGGRWLDDWFGSHRDQSSRNSR